MSRFGLELLALVIVEDTFIQRPVLRATTSPPLELLALAVTVILMTSIMSRFFSFFPSVSLCIKVDRTLGRSDLETFPTPRALPRVTRSRATNEGQGSEALCKVQPALRGFVLDSCRKILRCSGGIHDEKLKSRHCGTFGSGNGRV